jgi:cytochrome c oxidase subunit 3
MPLGAIKTLLLLTVSLCIALALRAAQTDKQKQINWLLGFAISLALVFITLTAIEYASKIQAGLSPAALLNSGGAIMAAGLSDGSHLYIALFFTMTGIHALHLLVGIGLLLWIMTKTRQQIYNSSYYTPLENVGLFWHFMSVIWLFIFPLLYLTTAI